MKGVKGREAKDVETCHHLVGMERKTAFSGLLPAPLISLATVCRSVWVPEKLSSEVCFVETNCPLPQGHLPFDDGVKSPMK